MQSRLFRTLYVFLLLFFTLYLGYGMSTCQSMQGLLQNWWNNHSCLLSSFCSYYRILPVTLSFSSLIWTDISILKLRYRYYVPCVCRPPVLSKIGHRAALRHTHRVHLNELFSFSQSQEVKHWGAWKQENWSKVRLFLERTINQNQINPKFVARGLSRPKKLFFLHFKKVCIVIQIYGKICKLC